MKVIQITDEDAKELIESLELSKWRGSNHWLEEDLREIPEEKRKRVEAWTHRHFHHVVVKWLQKHGARIT